MATEVSDDDFESLGRKLDGLEMNEAESAILSAIIARAAEANDEVSGFVLGDCIVNKTLPGRDNILIDFTGAGRQASSWSERMKIVIIGDGVG